MKETLQKLANELRKLAKEHEEEKMRKCAKVVMSATSLTMLANKIKGA